MNDIQHNFGHDNVKTIDAIVIIFNYEYYKRVYINLLGVTDSGMLCKETSFFFPVAKTMDLIIPSIKRFLEEQTKMRIPAQ